MVSEWLYEALLYEGYSVSRIMVFCDETIREQVEERFLQVLAEEWEKAVDTALNGYYRYSYRKGYVPVRTQLTDYGFYLAVFCLQIEEDEEFYGQNAFASALSRIVTEYPGVTFRGFIGYDYNECGYIYTYMKEVSETDGEKYEFIGEALRDALAEGKYEPEKSTGIWEQLEESLPGGGLHFEHCEDKAALTILSLYDYADWIDKEDLERAVLNVIDIVKDWCKKEKVEKLTAIVTSGLSIEKKINKLTEFYYNSEDAYDGDLTCDYEAALDMFLEGETLGAPDPEPDENGVFDCGDTFDRVFEAAEAGDPEAKFTAGKFLLADRNPEEKEKAIRWICEAAEAGVERAVKALEKNSSLFE